MKKVRLAFSGSGFLAPIHAGAICAFMDWGVEIVEVAGSSGGSVAAALVAAGFGRDRIRNVALAPIPQGIIRPQVIALFNRAINRGKILHHWLLHNLGTTTLGEAKVPITIMATDIEEGEGKAFTPAATPHVRIADACRASASVPFIWEPYVIDGQTYVDSGVVNNIPVDRLVRDDIPRIGIEVKDGTHKGPAGSFLAFAKQCLGTMLAANEGNLESWANETGAIIIPVSADPYGFLDGSLPEGARIDLYKRGYSAVWSYLHA